jgi:hypothetical protein
MTGLTLKGGFIVFKKLSVLIVCLISLSACAHRGAVRVDCKGPLRPINRPTQIKGDTPLSPPAPSTAPSGASAREGSHEG